MSDDKRRYSKVYRRMWNDARFRRLSAPPPNGQTLWLRLLTGPELTNIPGVFVSGEAGLAESLGWPVEGFREAFAEAFREGLAKADWKARLVFVPKAIHYNKPESPNVVRSWRQAWDELPECGLKTEAYRHLRAFAEGLGKAFLEAFAEACPDPSPNQEQEQEQEQEGGEGASAPTHLPSDVRIVIDAPQSEPSTPKTPRHRGTRLDPDWRPSMDLLDKLRARHRVDAMGSFDRFQNHWLSTSRNATKLDWDRTFANWVDEDVARGRLPKLDPADEIPLLRLPDRERDIPRGNDAPDFTGVNFGGKQ